MIRTEYRDGDWQFPFVEYAPENSEEPLPLVIQLHGAGERGWGKEDLALVDVHGFSKMAQSGEYPCRFVMPQCPPDTFWAARVESVLAFIEKVAEFFPTDRDRITLTGLSMGGFGTWYVAMAKPSLFAAISPVCGGGMSWNAGVLKMPVWVFHGVEDPTVPVMYADDMVRVLEAKGNPAIYSRLEGVRHNVWKNAYNEELLQWLLDQKK